MSIATFADGVTPLSGWHWVCSCGWSTHRHESPPTEYVAEHRAWHRTSLAAALEASGRG